MQSRSRAPGPLSWRQLKASDSSWRADRTGGFWTFLQEAPGRTESCGGWPRPIYRLKVLEYYRRVVRTILSNDKYITKPTMRASSPVASPTRRRSAEELLEWNRRRAEVVAGFAERHARVTVPSRRAGSAALDRKPYYIPGNGLRLPAVPLEQLLRAATDHLQCAQLWGRSLIALVLTSALRSGTHATATGTTTRNINTCSRPRSSPCQI